MSHRESRFGSIALAACFVASSLCAAPVTVVTEACPAIDPPTAPASRGAIRVFVDPATGRIRRSTPEERQRIALTSARDRAGRTYEVRTRPDGTRLVKLDETFMMSVVGRTNSDGTTSQRCGTTPAPPEKSVEAGQ